MTGLRLASIVLAAGLGTRFGGGKLTSAWGHGLLIDGALFAAFAAPVQKVIVVTGADPLVIAAAKDFAERTGDDRLQLVYAADHAKGLSASLQAGLAEAIEDQFDGVFVFLGDMPRVPVAVLRPLADAVNAGAVAAAPVHHGQRGHPVLFSSGLFDELMTLAGDKGAGGLLDALGERLATAPSPDEGVLFDIDHPQP